MNIGIDARTLFVKGGSRTYLQGLLREFKDAERPVLFGVTDVDGYVCVGTHLDQQNPFFRLIWENVILPVALFRRRIKLFHGTKGVAPLFSSAKKVITVHDLIGLKHPNFLRFNDMVYWKYIIPMYIRFSNHIIAVSEATKHDLIELLSVNPNKITVIHEAYSRQLFKPLDKDSCYKILAESFLGNLDMLEQEFRGKKVILNVNTISARKNIQTIIKSFNAIAGLDRECILVICGKKGWKYEGILHEYERSHFRSRIYFVDFVDVENLARLYNIASIFMYPSLYEGFGLPILEAQACGCPVITSSLSSMPETAGDGAILVDPSNQFEIEQAMVRLLSNPQLADEMRKKGFENLRRFSWERCARETNRIYSMTLYG